MTSLNFKAQPNIIKLTKLAFYTFLITSIIACSWKKEEQKEWWTSWGSEQKEQKEWWGRTMEGEETKKTDGGSDRQVVDPNKGKLKEEQKAANDTSWWDDEGEEEEDSWSKSYIYPPEWTSSKAIPSKYNWFLDWWLYILQKWTYRLWYENTERTAFFKDPELWSLLVTSLKDWNTCIITIKYKAKKQKWQLWSPQIQTITVEWKLTNKYSIKVQSDGELTWDDFKVRVDEVIAALMLPDFQQTRIEEL